MNNISKTHQDKAKAAIEKKASLGEDIDLTRYTSEDEKPAYHDDPSQLPARAKTQMLDAGVMLDDPGQRLDAGLLVERRRRRPGQIHRQHRA
jgi:hypothetical protein